jgi:hypothetical protein
MINSAVVGRVLVVVGCGLAGMVTVGCKRSPGFRYLALVHGLQNDRGRHSEESLVKLAGRVEDLFSISQKDIEDYARTQGWTGEGEQDSAPLLLLSCQLAKKRDAIQYAVDHYTEIAHPKIRLHWAALLCFNGKHNEVARKELRTALREGKFEGTDGTLLEDIWGDKLMQLKRLASREHGGPSVREGGK